ncbi:transposase [Lishizhenia tianjinensis]|nr:transposase [Lishizhenia tianjinensis]
MEILYLTCDFKKSPSICEIHRQSSLKRYETVYYMVQKIRIEMGDIIGKEFFEYNDLMEFDLHSKSNPLSMCEVYYGKSEGEKFDRIKLEIDCYSWNLADSIVHSKKKDYKMLKILFSNYGRPMFNAEAEKRWIRAKVMKYNWCKNVVGNFTRIVKGTYHHISLLHIQKAMDEYNFKYNYRKEIKSKIEIFLTKMSLLNGQTSG